VPVAPVDKSVGRVASLVNTSAGPPSADPDGKSRGLLEDLGHKVEQSFEALADGRAAPQDAAPTVPGEPQGARCSIQKQYHPVPAGSHLSSDLQHRAKFSDCASAPAGDKWGQAKSDAKDGAQKLGDAASEAYEAATMKAQRAGDQAAGKANELGVSCLAKTYCQAILRAQACTLYQPSTCALSNLLSP